MKALVTGANGFVGSAVLRHLVDAGHEVRVLLRPTSDRRNIEDVACEPMLGDVPHDPIHYFAQRSLAIHIVLPRIE